MHALIYKPARNAMQSGRTKSKRWRIAFEEREAKFVEPLMGWTGTRDTMQQVDLWFDTKEEAIAYCDHKAIPYTLEEPNDHHVRPSSYADNFRFDRIRTS